MKYSETTALNIFLESYDTEKSFMEIILDIEANYDDNCVLSSISYTLNKYYLTTLIIEVEEALRDAIENKTKD